MVIQFGTDSGSSYIVEFENSDRRKVVLGEDNSLELSQENIEYFYGEINKIFNKYSSNYVLEDLFEAFKLDLEKEIVNLGANKNPKEIITAFGLSKKVREKLESLFMFLEIEKQIELGLKTDIYINQGISDLINLYNANSEIKIENNDDIKNQIGELKKIEEEKNLKIKAFNKIEKKDEKIVEELRKIEEELRKIEKNNKFLESILKKIEENEKKQKKLEVYKNGLDKIKEEYNLDLFFSYFSGASFKNDKIGLSENDKIGLSENDKIGLSENEKKVFSQLYSSAISGVKDIESNITRFYSEENPEYKKNRKQKKIENKETGKALWEEEKSEISGWIKGVIFASVISGIAGSGVYKEKEIKKDFNLDSLLKTIEVKPKKKMSIETVKNIIKDFVNSEMNNIVDYEDFEGKIISRLERFTRGTKNITYDTVDLLSDYKGNYKHIYLYLIDEKTGFKSQIAIEINEKTRKLFEEYENSSLKQHLSKNSLVLSLESYVEDVMDDENLAFEITKEMIDWGVHRIIARLEIYNFDDLTIKIKYNDDQKINIFITDKKSLGTYYRPVYTNKRMQKMIQNAELGNNISDHVTYEMNNNKDIESFNNNYTKGIEKIVNNYKKGEYKIEYEYDKESILVSLIRKDGSVYISMPINKTQNYKKISGELEE